jgi:hypothetical protein
VFAHVPKQYKKIARGFVTNLDFGVKLIVFIIRAEWNKIILWTQRCPQCMSIMKNYFSVCQSEPSVNQPELLQVVTSLKLLDAFTLLGI